MTYVFRRRSKGPADEEKDHQKGQEEGHARVPPMWLCQEGNLPQEEGRTSQKESDGSQVLAFSVPQDVSQEVFG